MKSSQPIEFYQHVSWNIRSLKWFGLWFHIPHPVSSVQFWLHVFVRIVSGILVFTIPPIGQIIYFVKLIASENFKIQEAASSINLIFTELLTSLKLLNLLARRDLLASLTDQLINGEFHRTGVHRNSLENAIKLSRRLFIFFLTGASLDVLVHMVVAPGLGGFRTLAVKMDLIFIDVNDPAYFNYVYIYQVMYKPIIVTAFIALQTLPWAFLLFAITQLDILIYNFENMKELVKAGKAERNCNENDAFKEIFTGCVLHHRAIIRLQAHRLRVLEAFIVPLVALYDIHEKTWSGTTQPDATQIESPMKDLVSVGWVLAYLQIFILMLYCDCYVGNAIFVKSTEIATVAFGCPWLTLSTELKRNLIVFIARAQKPILITAYNLVPISLPTFTKVMNWTYKAFAVMNEMKK